MRQAPFYEEASATEGKVDSNRGINGLSLYQLLLVQLLLP